MDIHQYSFVLILYAIIHSIKYVSVSRSIEDPSQNDSFQHQTRMLDGYKRCRCSLCPEPADCANASRELQALRPARIHETRPCWWLTQNLCLHVCIRVFWIVLASICISLPNTLECFICRCHNPPPHLVTL